MRFEKEEINKLDEILYYELNKVFAGEFFELSIYKDDETDKYVLITHTCYKHRSKSSKKTIDFINRYTDYMKKTFDLDVCEQGKDQEDYLAVVFGPMDDVKLFSIYNLLKMLGK